MVRDYSQKTVQELYETIRVNVDEEEQWKVFDFVEDFFMEELEIGDYINDINSYHLHMFDKHDVTTKKLDVIVEKAGKVDANYAAQIEGYCSLLGEYGKKFEAVCAMLQSVIVDQSCSRIYCQRSSTNDKHICMADIKYSIL